MCMRERIIQPRAFFDLPVILVFRIQQKLRRLAALGAHGINFKSNSSGSPNG